MLRNAEHNDLKCRRTGAQIDWSSGGRFSTRSATCIPTPALQVSGMTFKATLLESVYALAASATPLSAKVKVLNVKLKVLKVKQQVFAAVYIVTLNDRCTCARFHMRLIIRVYNVHHLLLHLRECHAQIIHTLLTSLS